MIDDKRVLCLIPARGGSKGLSRKNLRPLAGRPLVAWPVSTAIATSVIDRVVVSTDDHEIAAAARGAGAEVPFMRPPQLATDEASSAAVVRHVIETLSAAGDRYDYIVLLEPTSPLTEATDVENALAMLHNSRGRADAIVGISQVVTAHPEYDVRLDGSGLIRPYAASDFRSLRRRQEIDELYFLEGSLYISATGPFLSTGTFYHERTLGHVMPRWKAFEIDELVDLICVEALLQNREKLHDAG